MKLKQVKTIDVNAKEWFDRANGNSYFSACVVINYGMKNAITFRLPYQYGYGDHYREQAFKALKNHVTDIPAGVGQMWQLRDSHGVIIRNNKEEKCTKREVVSFGRA